MVARRAEVSRTFLYQNEEAKKLLAEATADGTAHDAGNRSQRADQATPWRDRALNAEDALKAAYAEIGNQRDQIGRLLGQIRDLEIDLPADAVERITAENRTFRQDNRKLTTENQRLTDRLKVARENNRFLDTRIAHLEAELAEHLSLGQYRSKIMPPISAPDQEKHEGPHDQLGRSGLSGRFEVIGEAAEGDREPAAEARENTPARARRDHA